MLQGIFEMNLFRALLVVILAVISIYTVFVVLDHGLNLLPIFFGDMAKMGWPGQFNLDFMGFLTMSACWLAWRHHFSASGLLLAVGGFFLGAPYLCIYLLIMSYRVDGNVARLFLGDQRAAAV